MEYQEIIRNLELLFDGVDPETGELFPENSPYQRPQSLQALHGAIKLLSDKSQQQEEAKQGQEIILEEEAKPLFEELRLWRNKTAESEDCSPQIVLYNKSLRDIANKRPTNREELECCWGVKEVKSGRYGDEILEIVSGFLE